MNAARDLPGPVWVVKAQIHAGGRGKGGGVKVVKSLDEVDEASRAMLGMNLVTTRPAPAARKSNGSISRKAATSRVSSTSARWSTGRPSRSP